MRCQAYFKTGILQVSRQSCNPPWLWPPRRHQTSLCWDGTVPPAHPRPSGPLQVPQGTLVDPTRHKLHYRGVAVREEWDVLRSLLDSFCFISARRQRKYPVSAHRVQAITGRLLWGSYGLTSQHWNFLQEGKMASLSSEEKLLRERLGKGMCVLCASVQERSNKPHLSSLRGMHGHMSRA